MTDTNKSPIRQLRNFEYLNLPPKDDEYIAMVKDLADMQERIERLEQKATDLGAATSQLERAVELVEQMSKRLEVLL